MASGVDMDEGAVKADSSLEEAFVTEVFCDGMGLAGAAFEDEVEGAVLGVPRLGCTPTSAVVGGVTVGGGDELQWLAKAFADLVNDEEGGRHGGPEFHRW